MTLDRETFPIAGTVTVAELLPAPNASELYSWLGVALFLLGIYYLVLRIVKEHRRTPSIDVEIKDFATKDSVAKIEVKIPQLATKDELNAATSHADRERRRSAHEIYQALDAQEKLQANRHAANEASLHRLDERTETHTQQLAQLDQKIDAMPERIMKLVLQAIPSTRRNER